MPTMPTMPTTKMMLVTVAPSPNPPWLDGWERKPPIDAPSGRVRT